MLLLLQVAAFCQLFFLPGLLIMYLLRLRPDPLFLPPLAFSLSGVFNYGLVMLLSVTGIFCREAMLTLLIAECELLGVFLCRNGLRPCGGRMREELRSFLREGGRIRNVLFLLAAGVLVWQIFVAVRSFGSIFLSWDSVLSWNRWAAAETPAPALWTPARPAVALPPMGAARLCRPIALPPPPPGRAAT